MAFAAAFPLSTASGMPLAPLTASPPAKNPFLEVSKSFVSINPLPEAIRAHPAFGFLKASPTEKTSVSAFMKASESLFRETALIEKSLPSFAAVFEISNPQRVETPSQGAKDPSVIQKTFFAPAFLAHAAQRRAFGVSPMTTTPEQVSGRNVFVLTAIRKEKASVTPIRFVSIFFGRRGVCSPVPKKTALNARRLRSLTEKSFEKGRDKTNSTPFFSVRR